MTKPDVNSSPRKLRRIGYYGLTGRLLGKGNFARVEEANHLLLKVKVAIKVIDTTRLKDEAYVRKNLEREARMLSLLAHPSIMSLYETFQHGHMYYLVTELATGGNLCSYVKRQKGGRLDERQTLRFSRQLVAAVAHMHHRGVVHRDLKMENIMLDSSKEQIKIVDFGLSNEWSAGCTLQTHCGSPEYAAPELFDSRSGYGAEVDIWSLGVIVYGMAVGRLPFILPRAGMVSTTERRNQLLKLVNRGYNSSHDAILLHMSHGFRDIVRRLLTAVATERITISQLTCHPWITARQTKMATLSEYQPISNQEYKRIVSDISEIVKMNDNHISLAIETNRLGQVAGMFNVMSHHQRITNHEKNKCAVPRPRVMTSSRPQTFPRQGSSVAAVAASPATTTTRKKITPLTSPLSSRQDGSLEKITEGIKWMSVEPQIFTFTAETEVTTTQQSSNYFPKRQLMRDKTAAKSTLISNQTENFRTRLGRGDCLEARPECEKKEMTDQSIYSTLPAASKSPACSSYFPHPSTKSSDSLSGRLATTLHSHDKAAQQQVSLMSNHNHTEQANRTPPSKLPSPETLSCHKTLRAHLKSVQPLCPPVSRLTTLRAQVKATQALPHKMWSHKSFFEHHEHGQPSNTMRPQRIKYDNTVTYCEIEDRLAVANQRLKDIQQALADQRIESKRLETSRETDASLEQQPVTQASQDYSQSRMKGQPALRKETTALPCYITPAKNFINFQSRTTKLQSANSKKSSFSRKAHTVSRNRD